MEELGEGIVPAHQVSSLEPLQPPRLPEEVSHYVAQRVKIPVTDQLDHHVPAILHMPNKIITSEAAVVLISGAGGGTSGPSGMYVSLADKLARLCALPTLRLDYREPAANQYCTEDVLAGMGFLADRLTASKFVVCGWSFGSAPALTAAAKDERIKGVALVAPQTAETSGIRRLAPRSLLLMHGTGDKVLSVNCSRQLYEAYGEHSQGDRTLKLFDRDDHALSRNALDAEGVMFDFVARVLGKGELAKDAADGARQELIGDKKERTEVMKQGHDLEGESL